MASSGVKVLLRDGENVETLWADRVGPDLYRLDNSPFWAYGVSWLDVVEAHPDADGVLVMAIRLSTYLAGAASRLTRPLAHVR
ncbi:MAG TPA: DUF4265 domain-containing protein [Gemmatimonadaceae bacterium]|nr:DUF4265 domain-containing protein [Gemmatimonadaceae bacterium]